MATHLEIGSKFPTKQYGLVLLPRRNGSFNTIDLSHRPEILLNALRSVVSLIKDNILKPLDIAVGPFDLETLTTQSRPLGGRVVFDSEHVESTMINPPALGSEDGTFIIAGGLGSLGEQLCW